jgi:hypothetical protein
LLQFLQKILSLKIIRIIINLYIEKSDRKLIFLKKVLGSYLMAEAYEQGAIFK